MTTRKITILIGLLIFIGAIFLFNILAAGPAEEEQNLNNGVAYIGVPVIEAAPKEITSEISFTGSVIPEDEIQLFAEVTGNLIPSQKAFKAGVAYKKGDIIIQIDDREQQQTVLNQKSQFKSLLTQVLADINIDYPKEYEAWRNYLEDMDITKELEDLPVSENKTFNLFLTGRSVPANYFAIKQGEVRLSKYTLKAPYDGVLTESLINPGSLVRSNQRLGQFTKTTSYEIEASINANDRFFIQKGGMVNIKLDGNSKEELKAKVARINSRIDASTQTVLVYLQTRDNRVLAGQYVSGSISGQVFDNAQKVATKSLVRNDLLFVIEDSTAALKEIEVLMSSKDSAIVKGISTGDLVIDEFRDASFEGTRVVPVKN